MKQNTSITSASRAMLAGLALAALSASYAALAEAPVPDAYRMAVILDEAHGESLLAGEFGQAIAELESSETRRSIGFSVSNNLCVAYIMAKQAENAKQACEAAVRASQRNLRHASDWALYAHKLDNAVALTNRGVVLAITGDLAAAKVDFEKAIRLRIRLSEPVDNLKRLKARLSAAL